MIIIDDDNFKIPNSCIDCSLCYDYIYCSITNTKMGFEHMDSNRLNDCPLKEIDN